MVSRPRWWPHAGAACAVAVGAGWPYGMVVTLLLSIAFLRYDMERMKVRMHPLLVVGSALLAAQAFELVLYERHWGASGLAVLGMACWITVASRVLP